MTGDNWLFETNEKIKQNHGTTRTVCFEFLALIFVTHTYISTLMYLQLFSVSQCLTLSSLSRVLSVSIC